MAGRSRLRTQRNKGRRLVLAIFVLISLGLCYWFFIKENHVRHYVHTLIQAGGDLSAIDRINRGVIYDRNLKELAVSMDRVSVYATIRELDSLQETAMRLAPVVNTSEESLLEKLKKGSIQVWLAENITQEEEKAVRRLGLKGIFLHREKVRYYPQQEAAAHFLGYTENQMGLAGVEYTYNQWLNQYGRSSGNNRQSGIATKKDGERNGSHNLILTIDLKIQDVLYKYVTEIGAAHAGIRLGAMVMEAKSGDVVGCVNYPSFDPNRFREYKKSVLGNIFVEPAAIPKNIRSFFLETASLQSVYEKDGRVLPWSVAFDPPSLGTEIRLWEKLGLNEPLHLDFVAENEKPERLKLLKQDQDIGLDTGSVPQIATPMQVLTAMARIVNGGKEVIPHVVDSKRNQGAVPSSHSGEASVVPGEVSREARRLFSAMARPGPLSSGTITGEGLSFSRMGDIDKYLRNTIMLSMIPATDPELVLMVVADLPGLDPGGSGRAGRVDLETPGLKMIYPIVTFEQVFTTLSGMMTAEKQEKKNYRPNEPIKDGFRRPADVHGAVAGPVKMPSLLGLSLRKSLRLLKGVPVEIRVHGTGRVVGQDPAPDTVMADVKVCTLTLQPMVDKKRPGKELKKFIHSPEIKDGSDKGKD